MLSSESFMTTLKNEISEEMSLIEIDRQAFGTIKVLIESNAHENLLIPELTVQFMGIISFCFDKDTQDPYYTIRTGWLPYIQNNKAFALEFYENNVYMFFNKYYDRHLVYKQVKFWKKIYNKTLDVQRKFIYNLFLSKKASIFNHFLRELREIQEQEKRIEKIIQENRPKSVSESFLELYLPRKAFKGIYEIKSYILGVFSTIEYCANCLLPFWEAQNDSEWKSFISNCRTINNQIVTWTDLYDEKLTGYKTSVVQTPKGTSQYRKPAQIDVVNEVIRVIDAKKPDLKIYNEYRSLKNEFRNVVAHGEIGNRFYHGITTNVPSLFNETSNVSLFDGLTNIDYHAFQRVSLFLNKFIVTIEELFPIAYRYISSSFDIPADPSEYIQLVNGDLEKAQAYIDLLQLNYAMLYIDHMGESITISNRTASVDSQKAYLQNTLEVLDDSFKEITDVDDIPKVKALINEYTIKRFEILGFEIPG